MNAQLNWKEMAQLLGGIALVVLIQTGLMFPESHDFIGTWVIVAFFGAIYAIVGTTTWIMFAKRRGGSTMR
jgi:hypothetical protein